MPTDDYIKRSDAKKILSLLPADLDAETMQRCIEAMSRVPAADVEPVTHGRWIERMLDNFRKYESACSECGARYIGNYDQYCEPTEFSYCPNCGAKMDKEEDDENRT